MLVTQYGKGAFTLKIIDESSPDELELDSDSTDMITSGNIATDKPNEHDPISLRAYWNITEHNQWHNHPKAQELHSLRNYLQNGSLESAYSACNGIRKNLVKVTKDILADFKKAETEKAEYLIGHALHTIQDSFSPAHSVRENGGNFNLLDICYYGTQLSEKNNPSKACYHEEVDLRDQIWLTKNAPYFDLTQRIWAPKGEKILQVSVPLKDFKVYDLDDSEKGFYINHFARLARFASLKYLAALAYYKEHSDLENNKDIELFFTKYFFEGSLKGYWDKIMTSGVFSCGLLTK